MLCFQSKTNTEIQPAAGRYWYICTVWMFLPSGWIRPTQISCISTLSKPCGRCRTLTKPSKCNLCCHANVLISLKRSWMLHYCVPPGNVDGKVHKQDLKLSGVLSYFSIISWLKCSQWQYCHMLGFVNYNCELTMASSYGITKVVTVHPDGDMYVFMFHISLTLLADYCLKKRNKCFYRVWPV